MEGKLYNEGVIIRDATEHDMSLVAETAQKLANYQNMPNGPKITTKELRQGFKSELPQFRCKIAEVPRTGMVIGYAVYYPTYSTWVGKAMWLRNLFVKENHRRCGVGQMLISSVIAEAVASGCARLDLYVLAWNSARFFYGKIGAQNLTERFGGCSRRLLALGRGVQVIRF